MKRFELIFGKRGTLLRLGLVLAVICIGVCLETHWRGCKLIVLRKSCNRWRGFTLYLWIFGFALGFGGRKDA